MGTESTHHRLRRLAPLAGALLILALPAAAQAAGGTSTSTVSNVETTITAGSSGSAAGNSGGVATSPLTPGIPQSSGGQVGSGQTSTIAKTGSVAPTSASGGFSTLDLVIIIAIAAIVIIGIVLYVGRDSVVAGRQLRGSKGKTRSGAAAPGESRHTGSKAPPKSRKQLSAAEKRRRKRGRAPRRK